VKYVNWEYGVETNYYENTQWMSLEMLYQAFKERMLKEAKEAEESVPTST
jgi:hypothetical protein